MELLWPILGPLDLVIHLGKALRLRISSARAPELIWEPFFDRFREKCEGFGDLSIFELRNSGFRVSISYTEISYTSSGVYYRLIWVNEGNMNS